jgi:hypothetical protein
MKNNKGETNMNTKPINDGGSAFPMGYHPEGNNADHIGMSLRDWFAGMAMQGLLSKDYYSFMSDLDDAVIHAYKVADAMIAERKKGDLP